MHNPPIEEFKACIRSVLGQTEVNWQWCITDDGSTQPLPDDVKASLEDPRISFERLEVNRGISEATNHAIRRADGVFIAFLDQDDELHPKVNERFLAYQEENPDSDVFYTDEDKLDLNGDHFDTFSKPRWSPERLRHQNYLNHLTIIRKSLIEEVGFLRSEFDGSQDYDLVLRVTEKAESITHIPEVLYHWRAIPTSVAASPHSKPEAHIAGLRAVTDHVARIGLDAMTELDPKTLYIATRRRSSCFPKVSIIIPSRGSQARVNGIRVVLLENCVESILNLSTYPNFEIVVVLDDDCPSETRRYLEHRDPDRLKIIPYSGEFNFSRKINIGVVHCSGEILLPLNDDTQVISSDWIEELVAYLEEEDVGVTAPLLLLENGLVQSAGHMHRNGVHHFASGRSPNWTGFRGLLSFPAERSGVTFACAAIKRSVFNHVGGLSETYPRSFNDVDFCGKVRAFGYRIIWTPYAALYHFESLTRDPRVSMDEVEQLYRRWGHVLVSLDEYLADAL